MDRERFDALARVLATAGSRRGALGTLLGLAALGGGIDALAKKGGKSKNRTQKKRRQKERRARDQAAPANCFTGSPCIPGPGTNLASCDFEGTNVLAGQNLRGSNLSKANLQDADASGAKLNSANLGGACLVDANLTGATTSSANFTGAIFCRTKMPNGTINNSGCNKGTRCCPTCIEVGETCGAGIGGSCCAGADCCETTCADVKTDPDNCGECGRECDTGEVCSNGFTCQDPSCLPVTEIENQVTLAANGGLTLRAAPGGPPYVYGAAAFGVPNGATFADIVTMEADFQFQDGTTCGAGTPRFCVIFKNRSDCACAQFPTTLCNTPNASGSTGNLIGNNTSGVWFRICDNGPNINTYTDALMAYGTDPIDYIFIVADSSNGNQKVTVEPCITIAV